MVHGEPSLDGGDGANHLLAVDLVRSADATNAASLVGDEGLVSELADHVLGAEREARGLRRAHVLGGDALEVGAHPDIFAEVLQGEYLPRSVNRNGNTARVGDLDAVGEGEDVGVGVLLDSVEVDCGGVRAYGIFEVVAVVPSSVPNSTSFAPAISRHRSYQ